jgi:hypothetical protein
MSPGRRLLLSLVVVAAVAGAACGDPPDKEMQQAQGAIDAARAAGADQYARAEFAAAEDALKRARDAVDQRDYRQALNAALDARERAQLAAKDTVNAKATARAEAEKGLAAATAALNDARAKVRAENGRGNPRAIAAARRTIASDETAVQEARTAFDAGDYPVSIDKSKGAIARLRAAIHDLDASTPTTGRRRH